MWKLHFLGKRSKISHLCIQLISTILPPSYTGWCAIKGNKNQGKKIAWHHWTHIATAVRWKDKLFYTEYSHSLYACVGISSTRYQQALTLFILCQNSKSVFCHMSVNIVNTHSVIKKKNQWNQQKKLLVHLKMILGTE